MKTENLTAMLYKPGGDTKVWNTKAHVLIVDKVDVAEYLKDGWLDHPSKLFETESPVELKTAEELSKLSVSDLVSELSANEYSSETISIARGIEADGKNRSTALEAYDSAIS